MAGAPAARGVFGAPEDTGGADEVLGGVDEIPGGFDETLGGAEEVPTERPDSGAPATG